MSGLSHRRLQAISPGPAPSDLTTLFGAVFAASPCPMAMFGHDGTLLAVSDEGGGIAPAGMTLRALARSYLAALRVAPPWPASVQADHERTLAGGERVREQLCLRATPWGACLTVVAQAAPLPVADLQTARLAALGFMVAGVCHEVTNPLTSLHSIVQILRSERQPGPDVLDKGLQNIAVNVKRILDISRRLVTFARVGDEPHGRFAVDEAVEEALVVLRHEGLLHGVDVSCRADPSAVIVGAIGQAREIFLNLLVNAVQAMDGAGRIDIQTRSVGSKVEVLVADSGPGVAAALRERIFEPFFTTKADRGDHRGTGLGLAISREIAIEHGGAIELRAGPLPGAAFCVVLPKAPS